jgi:hypothetical protein
MLNFYRDGCSLHGAAVSFSPSMNSLAEQNVTRKTSARKVLAVLARIRFPVLGLTNVARRNKKPTWGDTSRSLNREPAAKSRGLSMRAATENAFLKCFLGCALRLLRSGGARGPP